LIAFVDLLIHWQNVTRFFVLGFRSSILDLRFAYSAYYVRGCFAFGELAQLLTIPLAHVREMAFHLIAAFGDGAFLLLDFFGLLGQAGRSGVDLPGGFVNFGLTPLQAVFALVQDSLHFGELTLIIDELLAEGGHGQPLILAGFVQASFLLPDLLGFHSNLDADGLQIVLGLMGIGMKLGQVLAELPAGLCEFLATVARLLF
jgi:hypothetical protein